MKLTKDQEKAYKKILEFLLTGQKYFVLNGYAGTGKTTLMEKLKDNFQTMNEALQSHGRKKMSTLHFTATTNKAVTVLKHNLKIGCSTIHSLLGLIPSEQSGGLYQKYPPKIENSLIVIDEASMVDKELMKYIQQSSNTYIFVGDNTQLPPVVGGFAIFNRGFPEYKMTQVIRQKPGSLFQLVSLLRGKVEGGVIEKIETDGVEIIRGSKKDFDTTMFEDFSADDWTYTRSKYIGYTNNRVQRVNQMIETYKHGYYNIRPGDWLINNSYRQYKFLSDKITFGTDEMVIVNMVKEPEPFQDMLFYPVMIKNHWFRVPSHLKAFQLDIPDLIDLRNMYACTVHKAQGSTYDRVYINLNDLKTAARRNEDMFWRLLYVAVSRAREQVIFTGEL